MLNKLISMMEERRKGLRAAMNGVDFKSPLWEEMCKASALFEVSATLLKHVVPDLADSPAPAQSQVPRRVTQEKPRTGRPAVILAALERTGKPMRVRDILESAGIEASYADKDGYHITLLQLMQRGKVERVGRGLYALAKPVDESQ